MSDLFEELKNKASIACKIRYGVCWDGEPEVPNKKCVKCDLFQEWVKLSDVEDALKSYVVVSRKQLEEQIHVHPDGHKCGCGSCLRIRELLESENKP